MTYSELEKSCEKNWTTSANSQGATGYFFLKGMLYKWEAGASEPYVSKPVSMEQFLLLHNNAQDAVMKEILLFVEDKEYDRKFQNCEMKWTLRGPDSGGVSGLFLHGKDLFNWASEYLPPSELKPISVDNFLTSNKKTNNPALMEIVKYLEVRKDRR